MVATLTVGSVAASRVLPLSSTLSSRAHHLTVRVEQLLAGVDPVEVHLDIDLGANLAGAERAFEELLEGAAQVRFELPAAFVVVACQRGQAAGFAVGPSQECATAVDDRNVRRVEIGDRRGDEILDRDDLAGAKPRVAAHAQQNRGAGLLAVAAEHLALGQNEVNADGLDRLDRADAARQLAFKRADEIDVLHEVGGAERRRGVEQFVTGRAAGRQALFGERDAGAWNGRGRDVDRGATLAQLVGDAGTVQIVDDARGVGDVEIGVEKSLVGRGDAAQEPAEQSDRGDEAGRDDRGADRAEAADDFECCVHIRYCSRTHRHRHPPCRLWPQIRQRA